MDAALVASLEAIVSPGRLQRYRNAGATDLETAVLYLWNIQLAESLLPSIAVLEVALRNSVHNILAASYGDFWFQAVLHPRRYTYVAAIIAELTAQLPQAGQPLPVGKVIAELTFGFWPHVFARQYRNLWWSPPNSRLANVLPHHPQILPSTRADLHDRLLYFNNLRNRAMHHEAIFQGVGAVNRPRLTIDVLHHQLLETIGWINADAKRLLDCVDQFRMVHSQVGRLTIEKAIKREFQIP